jgi:diguanylate cyclase (GGDEF)-like protein
MRTPTVVPWVLFALLAALLSAGILGYASIRAQNASTMAMNLQRANAANTARQLGDFIEDANQLATATASVLGPVRNDRALVETTLLRLLGSARAGAVYGIGIWYEPYAFDGRTRYYGPYAHRSRQATGAGVLTYEWMSQGYNFHSQHWYRIGKRLESGSTAFTEPYFDTDYTYVSAVRPFDDAHGRFAGVVTVDTIMPLLQRITRANSDPPSRIIYVTESNGQNFLYPMPRALLAYAHAHGSRARAVLQIPPRLFAQYLATLSGQPRTDISVPLEQTDWIVHNSVDSALIDAEASRSRTQALFAVAGIWLLAALLVLLAWRAKRAIEHSRSLEIREAELTSEIADRIRLEEQLRETAYHDELTGLANRAAMLTQIESAIDRLRAWRGYYFAVLFIDLDRFNVVNDSLGHDAGDTLLALIARRLETVLKPDESLARLGGDEFVMLQKNASDLSDTLDAVQRVQKALSEPFVVSGQEIFVSASIGIASGDQRYERPEEILRDADLAMYHAKRHGRSEFALFEPVMHERAIEQLEMESDLRRAIARRELFVEFHPIISLADGRVAGLEALARWHHPRRGLVMPGDFIVLAEQTGLIAEIDEYVMNEACAAARPWVEEFPGLYLAVNASAADLSRGVLGRMVSKALAAASFPGSALKIEITETAVMENAEVGKKLLRNLPSGVRIQIDDFGTGYSSLSYLQSLPIDELKIDRSFVLDMLRSAEAAEIVRAIISLAKTLRLNVTAEGVEQAEQAHLLGEWGVDFGQGHYYTTPLGSGDVDAFIRSRLAIGV